MRRLYDRYAGYAMAVALRYIPQHDEVRDVMQDSFVKILTSVRQFDYRGEGSLKSWICRIVANQAINYLRERASSPLQLEGRAPLSSPEGDTKASPRGGLEGAGGQEEEASGVPPDVLMEMISRLPTNYRTVLNLFAFEQYSHREIAQQLGIKENTSSSIFFRAKRMLGKMIKEYIKQQEI